MIQAEGLVKATNAILPISSYVHELQKERAKTVLYINKRVSIDELKKQREQVNQFHTSLKNNIDSLEQKKISIEVQNNLDEINKIRSLVDNKDETVTAPSIAKKNRRYCRKMDTH